MINKILKYAIWAGIYLTLLIPFIVFDNTFFPFITGKAFVFRIIAEIILGLWLVLIIRDEEFRPKWSWVLGAAGLFTFILLIADINAVAPFKAFWSNFERMEGWVTFIHLLAYFVVLGSMFNSERKWLWFFRTAVVSPILYVVFEYFSYLKNLASLNTIDPTVAHPFTIGGYMNYMGLVGDRWAGPLGNPIYLGVLALFLAYFLIILIHQDIINKKKEKNIYSKIYSGVIFSVMIATFCFIFRGLHIGIVGSGFIWWGALIADIILGLAILAILFRQQLFKSRFSSSVLFSPTIYGYVILLLLYLYIIATTSRGVLLGFGIGIFFASLLIAIFEKSNLILKRISTAVFVSIVIMGLFYSTFVFRDTVVYKDLHLSGIAVKILDTNFVKTHSSVERLLIVSWSNLNGQARQLIWPMALKGFEEKPILGWGQEGFNYVFNKYYDPAMYGQESWFDRAHNAPLDFLVAGGILGFLSYLALFGSALYLLWFRRNKLSITERALLTGLFAGYLFQAIFVFDNLISYVLFFTTLAYVHSRIVEDEKRKTFFSFLSNFVSDEEYQNYILIPVVVIATAAGVYFINIPGIQANRTLIDGLILVQKGQVLPSIEALKLALSYKTMGDAEVREQLISLTPSVLRSNGVDQKTKQDFLNLTFNEVENQIAIVPDDARYYILAGSLLNGIGNSEQALSYIKKAIELSPKKQTMRFELVQALYALGSSTEAMKEAKSAYELDERYEQAKQVYKATVENEIKSKPQFKVEGTKILNDLGVK